MSTTQHGYDYGHPLDQFLLPHPLFVVLDSEYHAVVAAVRAQVAADVAALDTAPKPPAERHAVLLTERAVGKWGSMALQNPNRYPKEEL